MHRTLSHIHSHLHNCFVNDRNESVKCRDIDEMHVTFDWTQPYSWNVQRANKCVCVSINAIDDDKMNFVSDHATLYNVHSTEHKVETCARLKSTGNATDDQHDCSNEKSETIMFWAALCYCYNTHWTFCCWWLLFLHEKHTHDQDNKCAAQFNDQTMKSQFQGCFSFALTLDGLCV